MQEFWNLQSGDLLVPVIISTSVNTSSLESMLLNKLVLSSEILNGTLENRTASRQELIEIYHNATKDPDELFLAAQILRRRFKKGVTFSKKAFFNLVNLCRDTCTYCTYKAEPGEDKASMMSWQQTCDMLRLAKRYRCVEALFVTGENPEQKYGKARKWLAKNGFASTAEYLIHASEMALELGLFPHTNAGNLDLEDMRELKKTNVSLGVMLENISTRLAERGMPHHMAASKRPEARLRVLRDAGRLQIPMTTGILLGIGETAEETIDSLLAIRDLHCRYGNIQETILQNFQPKPDTMMRDCPPAGHDYFKIIVALSRVMMPRMNIQIPPNLSPKSYHEFLAVGINDWGGISPITQDHVNPEFAWPDIATVEKRSADAGFPLDCRFPAYPEFLGMAGSSRLREKISAIQDDRGLVRGDYWR